MEFRLPYHTGTAVCWEISSVVELQQIPAGSLASCTSWEASGNDVFVKFAAAY